LVEFFLLGSLSPLIYKGSINKLYIQIIFRNIYKLKDKIITETFMNKSFASIGNKKIDILFQFIAERGVEENPLLFFSSFSLASSKYIISNKYPIFVISSVFSLAFKYIGFLSLFFLLKLEYKSSFSHIYLKYVYFFI